MMKPVYQPLNWIRKPCSGAQQGGRSGLDVPAGQRKLVDTPGETWYKIKVAWVFQKRLV